MVVLLGALHVAPAQGCDPNHDWRREGRLTRMDLAPGAARELADRIFARLEGLPVARIALVLVEDAADRAGIRTGDSDESRERGPDEAIALEARVVRAFRERGEARGYDVVGGVSPGPPQSGRGESGRGESGRGESGRGLDREHIRELCQAHRLDALVRIRLMDYAQSVHLSRDAYPVNAGLFSLRVIDHVRARVSVHDPDGGYHLIDELRAAHEDGAVFWERPTTLDVGQPGPTTPSLVELKLGRPGSSPARFAIPDAADSHFPTSN